PLELHLESSIRSTDNFPNLVTGSMLVAVLGVRETKKGRMFLLSARIGRNDHRIDRLHPHSAKRRAAVHLVAAVVATAHGHEITGDEVDARVLVDAGPSNGLPSGYGTAQAIEGHVIEASRTIFRRTLPLGRLWLPT